jgi:SAM-dependent methyltransferase
MNTLIRELLRGKSIPRALLAHESKSVRLEGKGIDLGSRDGSSAQYRYMDTSGAEITFTDLHPKDDTVVQLDVESNFPIDSESFDFVLAFYLLEHVFDTRHVLAEAFRITRPGGMIFGVIPQTEQYHPDPDDYLRFTSSGISRFLTQAGYKDVQTVPIGTGPASIATGTISSLAKIRPITVPLNMLGITIDLAIKNIARRRLSNIHAFSHMFVATRPLE